MKLTNYWLRKSQERNLLKIIDWAQRNGKPVETLDYKDIQEAMRKMR